MIALIIILGTYGVVITIALVNQVKRVNKLETVTNTAVSNMEKIYSLIQDSKRLLDNPQLLEAFRHDDEVGGFFNNIKSIQETLSSYIDIEHEGDE